MTDSETAAHPHPQLERPDWTSLNGPWRFAYDDERRCLHPRDVARWDRSIEVPFPPECERSGIHDTGFHPCCWYEREFTLVPGDGRALLRFGAVDYIASVWVNGHLAVTHEGGHTPFFADITALLDPSGRQTVTVRAFDDPHDLTKPRGKQDWQREPHAIWYPRTTGIWQTVWLERVGRTYVDRIRWTPHVETYAIRFEARIAGDPVDDLAVEVTLHHGERLLARDRYQVMENEADRFIVLADPGIDDFRNELLWSPERPTLLAATVKLLAGNETIDEFSSYTALRSISILRDRFMLNGRPYLLRMVLDQGYWPDTLHGGAERRRAASRRRAGEGNGLQRRAQAPEDRGPALSVLGRSSRPDGLGRDAGRLPLHPDRDQADDPRVERGDRARLQPSLRRRLDTDE